LPKGKEDPVQVFFFLLWLANTNEAIRARLWKWFSAVKTFAKDEEMGLGNIVLRAKRFELKSEHNLGLKIMLWLSALRAH
jgi:hypothetical protein